MGQLDPAVETVIIHFCELIFDAVNQMVLCSHDQFASTLWSSSIQYSSSVVLGEAGDQQERTKPGRVVSFNVPDSPEKADSLAEVLKQDAGEMQARVGDLLHAK